MQFKANEKYGVEIEMRPLNRDRLAIELTKAGFDVRVENFNKDNRPWWKLTTDRTCGDGDNLGAELVSPPLKGVEGFAEISRACKVLEAFGAKVDFTCGLHVHHDLKNVSLKTLKASLAFYAKHENGFDLLMPEDRRGDNNYQCRSTRQPYWRRLDVGLHMLMALPSVQYVMKAYGDRHIKVNPDSINHHGTLEFRHHHGTHNALEIINWVILTQRALWWPVTLGPAVYEPVYLRLAEAWACLESDLLKGDQETDKVTLSAVEFYRKKAEQNARHIRKERGEMSKQTAELLAYLSVNRAENVPVARQAEVDKEALGRMVELLVDNIAVPQRQRRTTYTEPPMTTLRGDLRQIITEERERLTTGIIFDHQATAVTNYNRVEERQT